MAWTLPSSGGQRVKEKKTVTITACADTIQAPHTGKTEAKAKLIGYNSTKHNQMLSVAGHVNFCIRVAASLRGNSQGVHGMSALGTQSCGQMPHDCSRQ